MENESKSESEVSVIPGLQACPVLDTGESISFLDYLWIPAFTGMMISVSILIFPTCSPQSSQCTSRSVQASVSVHQVPRRKSLRLI